MEKKSQPHYKYVGLIILLIIVIGILVIQNQHLAHTENTNIPQTLKYKSVITGDESENKVKENDRKRDKLISAAEQLLSGEDPNDYISAVNTGEKDYMDYYAEEWIYGRMRYAPLEPYYKGISLLSFHDLYSEKWGLYLQGDLLKEFEKVSEENKGYIEEAINEIGFEGGETDNERVEKILEYLRDNTKYNTESHTVEGLCVNKIGNCSAYAEFFYGACIILDIPCQILIGDATNQNGNTELHAWNRIYSKENKAWYYVDPCWASYEGSRSEKYSLSQLLWEDHTITKELP